MKQNRNTGKSGTQRPVWWVRGLIYLTILIVAPPLVLAWRIAHLKPDPGPASETERAAGLDAGLRPFWLSTDDNIKIRGYAAPKAGGRTLVIILHGFGQSHADMLPRAAAMDPATADVCFLDFRGHGDSGPADCTFGFLESFDVDAALRRFEPEYDRMIVWGTSMGAAAAVVAARRGAPVDGLILEGLYDNLGSTMTRQAKQYRLPALLAKAAVAFYPWFSGVPLRQMNMPENIRRLHDRPLLLVHGRNDSEVPMSAYGQLKDALGPRHSALLLTNGDHEYLFQPNRSIYTREIRNFLQLVSK